MGTVIDRLDVARSGWRTRHSALRLAVTAAKSCLLHADRHADDVDLLINAGIYRDRNLAEPALAALIQEDVGAHPEDPHPNSHGTFSFDVANGACGVLTAMQIADGFLRSHAIERALIVASDADPGHRMSHHFPFSPVGAAMLCSWHDDEHGLGRVHWVNQVDDGESYSATIALEEQRNVLRFATSPDVDDRFAAVAARAVGVCLDDEALAIEDIDVIVAAPARPEYQRALAERLGVLMTRITVADDESMHTAALIAALERGAGRTHGEARMLLVAAGGGVTAGVAAYRSAAPSAWAE